jgi:CIC family chloride channel protein
MSKSIRSIYFSHVLDYEHGIHFVRPMILAMLVGIGTGFIVVGFVKALKAATNIFLNIPSGHNHLWGIFIPVLGGLLVGPLITFFAPEAKGHGVPEVLKAIVLRGGKIRPVVVLIKAIASIISIGSGFSVGREGPIVQTGAAFGSTCGQILKLSESRVKNLVACGAAAGIAGVFNTPIAGVIFASEVILRDFGANALSTVVVAAVSSSIIARIFLGDHPSFSVPVYHLHSSWEILLYFVLGILSALTAILFILSLERSERWFEQWNFPEWLKPAAGGLLIGCVGFFFPQICGSGLKTIEEALHGSLILQTLLILIFVKIFATSVSLGAGSSGGVFAPLLFIGAVLGGAVGNLFTYYHFAEIAPPGAYALVGMASLFAAAAHAPITAILIVFEMTGSYGMILPIMVAVIAATSVSQLLIKDSIYLRRLKHKGIDISSFDEAQILGGLHVSDAMSHDFIIIPVDTAVQELIDSLSKELKTIFAVDEKGKLIGVVKWLDLNELVASQNKSVKVRDVVIPITDYSFSDEPLNEAARLMGAHHLSELPVVDSLETSKIIGVLRAEDIFRTYSDHISKHTNIKTEIQHEAFVPMDMKTIIFTITPRSPILGQLIKNIGLPEGVHFNTIKRGQRFLIPNGKTILNLKDRVSSTVMPQHEKVFREWLKINKIKNF